MGLFGNISRALFGGSKSVDGNKFADQTNEQFSSWGDTGGMAHSAMGNILGLGGPEARSEALTDWWDSSGGDFMLGQGLDQVDAMYRSRGLGQSGAAMKAMEDYRSGLASSKMGEAMGYLSDNASLGLGAGSLVADAGRFGKGTESSGGLGKALGALLISDPDAKTDIEKTGEVGTYRFRYKDDPSGKVFHGFMADEVGDAIPEAKGPRVNGYRTINTEALGRLVG